MPYFTGVQQNICSVCESCFWKFKKRHWALSWLKSEAIKLHEFIPKWVFSPYLCCQCSFANFRGNRWRGGGCLAGFEINIRKNRIIVPPPPSDLWNSFIVQYYYFLILYRISEEKFWRNYFYRVSLICQANELSSMAESEGRGSVSNAEDDCRQTNG